MRTTLDIDTRLLDAARRKAADNGTTLTAVVEDALAAALTPSGRAAAPFKLRWRTHRGKLMPGVDIADRDALFDILEGRR